MHDGRAATLIESIALHGGESTMSTDAFFKLPLEDRNAVIRFLQSLKAPPISEQDAKLLKGK
jgi:CxxC motif-containing protein (DUF1111 family)